MVSIKRYLTDILAAAEAAGNAEKAELLRSALVHLSDAEVDLEAGRRGMARDALAMVELTLEGLGYPVPPELAALISEAAND